ncbi:DUF2690 domain-containing protein [Streptomyces actinomycinicus]|uniref:DUF2690 domain-containing protein n=1 Tax=Streptomyces actinomycinicus TaxID=1695166 RepID=A0A937EF42_9ACTN|nr:XRE family transcriptional regulator [Streptomyces actinomycinicus]MBL1081398.1 DUF2690 domain-containing protein [Streptomyces actinomycinicus]
MPRWKALPEDLDPQIKEFTGQLRRLLDRSGLSVAVLADRTGYSRTSWERYLDGRLLAPKGAVIALAEATGNHSVHLVTLWELAERAWSRAEMRHDSTMEAMRIAEARAALGDLGTTTEPAGGPAADEAGGPSGDSSGSSGRSSGTRTAGTAGGAPGHRDAGKGAGKGAGKAAGGAAVPGIAGPAGVSPTIPAQPAPEDADAREDAAGGPADGDDAPAVKNSWGLAGYRGPSRASARPGTRTPTRPDGPAAATGPGSTAANATVTPAGRADTPSGSGVTPAGRADTPSGSGVTPAGRAGAPWGAGTPAGPGAPSGAAGPPAGSVGAPNGTAGIPSSRMPQSTPAGPHGAPPADPQPAPAPRWSARRQQVTMFFAGLFGVLVLIAGVFFFTHRNGDGHKNAGAAKSPSPSAHSRMSLPPGVKCSGSACTGKDAEAMGCSGDLVTTAKSVTLGTTVLEVRYSRTCGAAWGRITGGGPGDTVRVTAGKTRHSGDITSAGDTIGYTPMVAVRDPADARACATLASGRTGCTS